MARMRRYGTWMLAVVLVTAGCASTQGAAAGGSAPESFDAFLASVSAATYQDYASKPGARVRSASAFQQMREYILTRYQGAQVARSFADADGAVFDCVRQPSAKAGPTNMPDARDTPGACPSGTVPTRRITLSDLVRFPTLQQFFGKSPGGTGQLPLPSTTPPRGSS